MKFNGDKEYDIFDQWDDKSGIRYDLYQRTDAAPGNSDVIAIRNNEAEAYLIYYEAHGCFPPSRGDIERDFKDVITRSDIIIDPDLEHGEDSNEIVASVEIWFDVDRKFGLHTKDRDDEWMNMYATLNPFINALRIDCVVSNDEKEYSFVYTPTQSEKKLFIQMMAETLQEMYGQTPEEFCRVGSTMP